MLFCLLDLAISWDLTSPWLLKLKVFLQRVSERMWKQINSSSSNNKKSKQNLIWNNDLIWLLMKLKSVWFNLCSSVTHCVSLSVVFFILCNSAQVETDPLSQCGQESPDFFLWFYFFFCIVNNHQNQSSGEFCWKQESENLKHNRPLQSHSAFQRDRVSSQGSSFSSGLSGSHQASRRGEFETRGFKSWSILKEQEMEMFHLVYSF